MNKNVQFRAVFEMTKDGMLLANDQGRYVDANPAACELLGMKRDRILGLQVADFADPQRRDDIKRLWRRFLQHKSDKGLFRIFRPDGTTRLVQYKAKANIAPHLHLSILRDVTERDTAERILRESEDRLRLAIESTELGMWDFDPVLRELNLSRRCRVIFGVGLKASVSPELLFNRVHPQDRRRLRFATDRSMNPTGDGRYNVEFRTVWLDGSIHWVIAKGRCFFETEHKKRRAVRFIGMILEVTDRKNAEQELLKAKEAAEAADKAKTQFLANISHEIRTPINGIVGTGELLRMMPLSSEQREYVDIIEDSGKTLMTLVDRLLDFSRIEASKVKMDVQNFDYRLVVKAVLALFTDRVQVKRVALATHVSKSVPSMLRGDPMRFRQVLTNLIANAIKFTEKGRIDLTISQRKKTGSHHYIRFSIKDTGTGISKSQQALLFKPFSQADNSAGRIYGGTGLGLAISKQLVLLMGGDIGVKSAKGKGSTFWFTLPFEKQSRAVERKALRHSRQTAGSLVTKAVSPSLGRVLVAEDNRINRIVAVRQLEKLGLTVDTVGNGKEAFTAAQRTHYDLIFMDCQMPIMDGYDATRQIRRHETKEHVPIVAMTAHAFEEDRRKCLSAGMDDYISKPVQLTRLRSILKLHIGKSALVDVRHWKQAASFGGDDAEDLMNLYITDTTAQIAQLKQAIESNSAEDAKAIAHSALGASTLLGMTAIAESLRRIEEMGHKKDLSGALEIIKQLSLDLNRTRDFLRTQTGKVC